MKLIGSLVGGSVHTGAEGRVEAFFCILKFYHFLKYFRNEEKFANSCSIV